MKRDHGGNIDAAMARHGGEDWIDLSTGINRVPYPLPPMPPDVWQRLPTGADMSALMAAARSAYGTRAPGLALAGAQAAIQTIPFLSGPGEARVLGPTYNEHAGALRAMGWRVREVATPDALDGADLAVLVNPNNPDGTCHAPDALRALAQRVGRLVVDESFADPRPDLSVIAAASDRLIVLRSFGKFWGLAGLRLGFAFAGEAVIDRMQEFAGPWPVSGAAMQIGRVALMDTVWHAQTVARLRSEAVRLDALAAGAGWTCPGGTELFRLYDTPDAVAAQDRLAAHRIWSRIFPYSSRWIRLGLPGGAAEWARLQAALGAPVPKA